MFAKYVHIETDFDFHFWLGGSRGLVVIFVKRRVLFQTMTHLKIIQKLSKLICFVEILVCFFSVIAIIQKNLCQSRGFPHSALFEMHATMYTL